MAVQVLLLDEAVADLADLAESGNIRQFLKKLLEIEKNGVQAGQPLGRDLTSWRKLTVGDRNWRIVFRVTEGVATVCVIGDREDEACYREASKRVLETADEELATLAQSMMDVLGNRKDRRRARHRR